MDDEEEIRVLEIREFGPVWDVVLSAPIQREGFDRRYIEWSTHKRTCPDRIAAFKWALEQIEEHKRLTS